MLIVATLLTALFGCCVAGAGECAQPLTANLYRDQPLDLQLFFENKPGIATPLQIYAGNKLLRSAKTDPNGRLRFGLLRPGTYRVVIRRQESLGVVVSPQKSGLNGPQISLFLFPGATVRLATGKSPAGRQCPLLVLKED